MKAINLSRFSSTLPLTRSESPGKCCTFGLGHIEYIRAAKAHQNGLDLPGDVLLGFGVLSYADHRRQDAEPFLPLDHLAAKLVPRVESGNPGGIRSLPCDLNKPSSQTETLPNGMSEASAFSE